MRYAVIGAGSWGTTVASMIAPRRETIIWARRPDVALEIDESHHNDAYLPGIELSDALSATSDLTTALEGADVVIMAVPSHGFRAVLDDAAGSIGRP